MPFFSKYLILNTNILIVFIRLKIEFRGGGVIAPREMVECGIEFIKDENTNTDNRTSANPYFVHH